MAHKQYTLKYYKARVIKTGKIVFIEWSDMAGEYYERGTGNAYLCDEIELID